MISSSSSATDLRRQLWKSLLSALSLSSFIKRARRLAWLTTLSLSPCQCLPDLCGRGTEGPGAQYILSLAPLQPLQGQTRHPQANAKQSQRSELPGSFSGLDTLTAGGRGAEPLLKTAEGTKMGFQQRVMRAGLSGGEGARLEATRVAGSHDLAALRLHGPQAEVMAFCQR